MNEYIEGNSIQGFCAICGKDFSVDDYKPIFLYKKHPELDDYNVIPVCRGFSEKTRCQIEAEHKGYTILQKNSL